MSPDPSLWGYSLSLLVYVRYGYQIGLGGQKDSERFLM